MRLSVANFTVSFASFRFQNRRAKWRRQEKAEANTLKINPDFPMSSFPVTPRTSSNTTSSSSPSCPSLVPTSLSMDPWLVSPFVTPNGSYGSNPSGPTNATGLPFFPTNCNVPSLYPASSPYPTPPLHHPYGSFSSDTNEILNETNPNNADSIAHLRIKAKEYMSAIIGTKTNPKSHLVWPQGV